MRCGLVHLQALQQQVLGPRKLPLLGLLAAGLAGEARRFPD